MTREYPINANRRVVVFKKNGEFYVTIEEPGSTLKSVTLTAKRWGALAAFESEIEDAVSSLQAKQYVNFKSHIGGGYFVSVTTGFLCVDIREFYFKDSPRPSKHGIALNLTQWTQLKEINQQIKQHFPKLAKTELCSHQNLDALINCIECHPFKDSIDLIKPY
jgi:hypothetical protein